MFESCVISGTLRRADGISEASAAIVFTPVAVVGSDGAILSTAPVTVTTSAGGIGGGGGTFFATLLTVTGGAVRYSCKLPCGDLFLFNLLPVEKITLDELLNQT